MRLNSSAIVVMFLVVGRSGGHEERSNDTTADHLSTLGKSRGEWEKIEPENTGPSHRDGGYFQQERTIGESPRDSGEDQFQRRIKTVKHGGLGALLKLVAPVDSSPSPAPSNRKDEKAWNSNNSYSTFLERIKNNWSNRGNNSPKTFHVLDHKRIGETGKGRDEYRRGGEKSHGKMGESGEFSGGSERPFRPAVNNNSAGPGSERPRSKRGSKYSMGSESWKSSKWSKDGMRRKKNQKKNDKSKKKGKKKKRRSTFSPTGVPTRTPTFAPATSTPTARLVESPTISPATSGTPAPSEVLPIPDDTISPTQSPVRFPTSSPTMLPTTMSPTTQPTGRPTVPPGTPTATPTAMPTAIPTPAPTNIPTPAATGVPTSTPTGAPTPRQTDVPTSAPITVAPTNVPTSTPTSTPGIQSIPRFYISLNAPNATRSPTQDEYLALANRTSTYFSSYLAANYATNDDVEFQSLTLELNNTRFDLGIPEPRYNIYMDFQMTTQYSETSVPDTPAEQFNILRTAINANYILNEVRMVPDSPFVLVIEARFASAAGIL